MRQKPLKLFLKIANNVLQNPGEAKFRRLNALKIVPKLSMCDGTVDLLEATGFKGDGETHYVLPEDDDLKLLRAAVVQLEAWEAAALELARKQARAIMQANMAESGMAAKDAYRADLRRKMAIQKKEKDQDYKPVVSSVSGSTAKRRRLSALLTPFFLS